MTPKEIKIEFIRSGIKIVDISKKFEVSPAAVKRVISRDSISERLMIGIAEAISIPKELVFPEHQFKS